MSIKDKAKQLKSDIPAVFMSLKDKRTPICVKGLAAITVAYALSPIDLIPDFIPILGYLDDIIILPGLIALVIKMLPDDVWEDNKIKSQGMWENGKPKKWYFAIPVMAFWLLIVLLLLKMLVKI